MPETEAKNYQQENIEMCSVVKLQSRSLTRLINNLQFRLQKKTTPMPDAIWTTSFQVVEQQRYSIFSLLLVILDTLLNIGATLGIVLGGYTQLLWPLIVALWVLWLFVIGFFIVRVWKGAVHLAYNIFCLNVGKCDQTLLSG